ncbi:enoyl-CoA-hydratase DpgB [Luedemannella helvata]|uniref:enoyl-CoA-hydratase DpgB n=1 Tax=Luedemannella helvata TaxID=349315 RepID=UPI0031DE0D86
MSTEENVVRVDGGRPLSAASVAAVVAACDRAEDGGPAVVRLIVSGVPAQPWPADLDVALVNRWERALRRLERLPAATVAVAIGDCGGPALDALLATDYRVATTDARLVLPAAGGAAWPGMALYRLAQQAGVAGVRRAVLFGEPIDARRALQLRLVDELTDDLDAAVSETGPGSDAGAELAIRRRLLLDATSMSFENALGVHLAACDRVLRRGTEVAA